MKIKKFAALLALCLTSFSLCSCGSSGEPAETPASVSAEAPEQTASGNETSSDIVTVTDMVGRNVEITPGSYKRVVCIGAGALRMYSYIGDISLLCGVEDIDNLSLEERPKMFDSVARPYMIAYGEEFSALPSCGTGGPNAQTAEAEKILSCDPDIVISEYEDADKENALQEQLGVPVITLKSGANGIFNENFYSSMRLLGTVFGAEERAEELIAFIEGQNEDIFYRTTVGVKEEEKPGVYICGLGNWGTTSHLYTAQGYIPFDIANIRNVVEDLPSDGIQPIEEEKFVSLGEATDIMIIDAAAVKNIAPLYAEDNTMFDTCKAWREGRVYLQMAYNAYYTNYEISLANTWFAAKTVYPELFEDIDMKEKTDEITEMFLGEKMAEEIFSFPSSFGGYGQIDSEIFRK